MKNLYCFLINYYYCIFWKNSFLVYNCGFHHWHLNDKMNCCLTSMSLIVNSHNHNTSSIV